MDPIEKAIRGAFEKGNAEDRAFRESVYRKAFDALDRALQANPELTVEAAMGRRKVLQSRIVEIETEFIPAVPALPTLDRDPPDPLAGALELRMEPGAAPTIAAPEVRAENPQAAPPGDLQGLGDLDVRTERREAAAAAGAPEVRPDPEPKRRSSRRPLALAFVAATLVALVAFGILFAQQTGLFLSPEERDTSVPNPPPQAEAEDFIPENEDPPVLSSQPEESRDWISIFTPADATSVSVPTGVSAETIEDDSGSFLRIRSGEPGSAVLFDVGQGVLEQIAGRRSTFDIVARSGETPETEMSVDCSFGELGDCGRKRYAVGYERGDFLFELGLPQAQPGAGGTIAINPDFAGEGRTVDIYEIKVSVSP